MGANQAKTPQSLKNFSVKKKISTGSGTPSIASESIHSDGERIWGSGQHMAQLDLTASIAADSVSSADSDLLVALYDFKATLESQICLQRGDPVRLLSYNNNGEWAEVDATCPNGPARRGWVPTSYLGPPPPPPGPWGAPMENLEAAPWFHGQVSRREAEQYLRSGINGSFLLRCSESQPGQLSVTLRHDGRVFHYRVSLDRANMYYITETHRFLTLSQLVEHHSCSPDGLVCPLLYPAPKRQPMTDPAAVMVAPGCWAALGSAWEVDRSEIIMRHKLGGGQYGDVYEAVWKRYNTVVAVKTVKEDVTMKVNDFLEEAAVMKNLRHENLVLLLGVCTREAPLYLVTEFMPQGSLLNYLRTRPRPELPPSILLHMTTQVAGGCAYLEKHNCIHRDLAARNCLVGDSLIVKVGDFGLARYMEPGADAYTARMGAKFPIKWTAPEGLAYNRFSSKSDVWAFGVVLWEVSTYGGSPYPGIELQQVYHLLEKGYRMERPVGCPNKIYEIMMACWRWEPEERPTFADMHTELLSMKQYANVDREVAMELERGQGHPKSMEKKRSHSMEQILDKENPRASPVASLASEDSRRSGLPPVAPGTGNSSRRCGHHRRHQQSLPGPPAPPPPQGMNALRETEMECRDMDTPDESGVGESIVSNESPAGDTVQPHAPSLNQGRQRHTTAQCVGSNGAPRKSSNGSAGYEKAPCKDLSQFGVPPRGPPRTSPSCTAVAAIQASLPGPPLPPALDEDDYCRVPASTASGGVQVNNGGQKLTMRLYGGPPADGDSVGAALRLSRPQVSGMLDQASLGQFATLHPQDRIDRYLESLGQQGRAPPHQPALPSHPPQGRHRLRPISRDSSDEDENSAESNTEEVTGTLTDSLSIASDSPPANQNCRTTPSLDPVLCDKVKALLSTVPPPAIGQKGSQSSGRSRGHSTLDSQPDSSTASQGSVPKYLNLSGTVHCNGTAMTNGCAPPVSSELALDKPPPFPSHILGKMKEVNSDPKPPSRDSLLESVNDLILQAEFLCATYPKMDSDLRHLASQLDTCVAQAVSFAKWDKGGIGSSVLTACSSLTSQVAALRGCSGQQARDINRCLVLVQAGLAEVKASVQHSCGLDPW